MKKIEIIKNEIEPLRQQLLNHRVYRELNTRDDLNVFLEHHVFAVWDFMSLLKSLQRELTCTTVPWIPKGNPITRKLINEIVLGEETDHDMAGNPTSHFELYLDAMESSSANTTEIECLIASLKKGEDLSVALLNLDVPASVKEFIEFTFSVIKTNQTHKIAAAFTFGREDLIPGMFSALVNDLNENSSNDLTKLIYYLNRHIELDSDVHGPLALKMIAELCDDDDRKWNDCLKISKMALQKRINLWDGILDAVKNSEIVATYS